MTSGGGTVVASVVVVVVVLVVVVVDVAEDKIFNKVNFEATSYLE